jgi:broad specificity phosphatase PhoE
MLELILARHGQSHGNLDRDLGPDTCLTDLGCQQARRLGSWLAAQGYQFVALYSSPLLRARQTAEIVNAHYGLEIALDPGLREADLPYLHALPKRSDPLGCENAPPFALEYEGMRQQVIGAANRILGSHSEGQVLVVAHAGTLGTLLRTILGAHALLVWTELTAVHCLHLQDSRWTLQYLNRREHLVDGA